MVSKSRRRKSVLLIGIVLVSVASASTPTAALPQSSGLDAPSVDVPEVLEGVSFSLTTATIVVDSDGSGDYRTIQAAVDNASAGDTVRIEPGVYAESVRISKPLDVRAPNGATLDGSSLSSSADGVRLYNDAKVSISGITVTGYDNAILANGVGRNVSLSDVTLKQNRRGLYVDDTYSRWEIHDSVVKNNSLVAIQTSSSSLGNATANYWGRSDGPTKGQCRGDVDCGYFLSSPSDSVSVPADRTGTYVVANDGSKPYATIQDAIQAAPSRATVEVRPGTYTESVQVRQPLSLVAPDGATLNGSARRSSADGVRLYNDANVTVSGFTVEGWDEGVRADNVDSEFLIENVVLRQNQDGLYVEETYNRWDIQHSEIYNNSHTGVRSADHLGDATENYWGRADGPTRAQCRGDVDCGYFLSSPTDSVSVPSNRTGTYVVANDGSKPYATMQDAIQAAPSHATVEVRPGTYTESVQVKQPLSLVAPDGATLNGSARRSSADGVRLYNDANVTVSGFTVERWDDGIRADNVNTRFLVENVVLRQNQDGLYVEETYNRWDIQHSEIYNNSNAGVRSADHLGDATQNYWGQSDGPTRGQCRGEADCGYFLSSPTDSVSVPSNRTGTYVVANDGSKPYATVQDAIRAAPARATVEVRPGTYSESVRLSKPLSLVAPDGATLNGSTRNSGVDGIRLYNDANVTVSGFTVEGWDHGIDAYNVDSGFLIENVVLRQNRDGLYVDDTYNGWDIQHSEIYNNSNAGVRGVSSQLGDVTRTTGASPTGRSEHSAAATWTAATSCPVQPIRSQFRPTGREPTSWRTTEPNRTPRFRTRFGPPRAVRRSPFAAARTWSRFESASRSR
ncbi:right-handed parallel beta-helix repeat-containing protein [Halorussus sp. MSC15.2]|uniref:right-handed parallel beta-helix repeat-containing protein n=1 Tax=Halorussus sp. MSC15.2 TaxID=2283638 RepID=UPI0013D4BAE6|nr:right-handed parallel beta-helix repeat-containing protein [Halorussus sp. MSC15.2]NEU57752.1 DUF1565 domain-containing protein [Halorussus sp. MSC15.2]